MSGAFDAAKRSALMSDLLRSLRGKPSDLLEFDRVRETLRLGHFTDCGNVEVPLEKIVGTLGRAREFNRVFLPRSEESRDRWRRISDMAEGAQGFPPVDLYQVGDAYFVVDGHHRVSVARAAGAKTIEARVKEFRTRVPLGPEDSLESVLLKRGLADFLEATGLTPEEPDEFRVTTAAGYERMIDHVAGHRYYRGIETGRDVGWPEAVISWRDTVYRAMIRLIRDSGIIKEFPGRTESDLYLFTMNHLHHLRELYGADAVPAEQAVENIRPSGGRLARWWRRLLGRAG